MRRRLWLTLVMGIILIAVMVLAQEEPIRLRARMAIHAGDAWELTIAVADGEAGDQISVALLNGVQVLADRLTLGSGGAAVWRLPPGQITQAGDSLVIVRSGEDEVRRRLRVDPLQPATVDFFTTTNTLLAYGQDSATIMILPRDIWGNAPASSRFSLTVRYPDGTRLLPRFSYAGGIGWTEVTSQGGPGLVRLATEQGALSAALELQQTPATPHQIDLMVEPGCVLNDGRSVIALRADVRDAYGYAVADGTLITFNWAAGFGYGRTVDGQAVLRIPAPAEVGQTLYQARVGRVQSVLTAVEVSRGRCDDGR